jgi:Ca2+-transporting ATPase
MRSHRSLSEIGILSNSKLVISFIICALLQILVISIAPLAKIFQVVPLSLRQWAIVILLSITPIIIVELQKNINNKRDT